MSFLAKHGARIAISLLPMLLALAHTTGLMYIGIVQSLDNIIYDAKLRWTMPKTLDTRIVIIDIDEKSLAKVGRWPWNRQLLATMTQELIQNQQVKVVGFDLVFAESDSNPGADLQLADAIQRQNVVLGYYFTSDRDAHTSGVLPKPALKNSNLNGRKILATEWDGYGSNIELLATAAPQAGFFNAITDTDGSVRSTPLLASYKGNYYESFALALYRTAKGYPDISPSFTKNSLASKSTTTIESIKLTQSNLEDQSSPHIQTIKVDDRASVLVPYRGLGGANGGAFKYISAVDVLTKKLAPAQLQNKIILIGSSAPGLQDLRITPVGQTYPGVETHANILSSMLDGKSIYKPDYALGAEVALLFLVGLTLAFVLPTLTATSALGFSLSMLLVPTAINLFLFGAYGVAFPLATLLLLSLLAYMLNMSYGFFTESRAKRELTQLFGSYVPPQLVEEMVQDPSSYTMKAANKDMTVMFCDLRGFTQLSENMEPTHLQHLLNDVFSRITQVILKRHGTIDKYMGDCVMAFWGAPVSMPNHAELAVQTAFDIAQIVAQINKEHRAKGLREMKLGIGINTGMMCVGDMGSFMRRSYTVVGDAVNIASRIEGLTKHYEVDLLAGYSTKLSAPQFDWLAVDTVLLTGKTETLSLFTLKTISHPTKHE
jgi:adenylate cyclase